MRDDASPDRRRLLLPALATLAGLAALTLLCLPFALGAMPGEERQRLLAEAVMLPYRLELVDWELALAEPLPSEEAARLVTNQGAQVTRVETRDEDGYRITIDPPLEAGDDPRELRRRYWRRDAEIRASLREISYVMETQAALPTEASPAGAATVSPAERAEIRAAATEIAALAEAGAGSDATPCGPGEACPDILVSVLFFRGSREAAERISRAPEAEEIRFARGRLRDGALRP